MAAACKHYHTDFKYGQPRNFTGGNNILHCVSACNDGGSYDFAKMIMYLIDHI